MPHVRTTDPKPDAEFNWLKFRRSELGEDNRTYWVCECVCGQTIRRRPTTIQSGSIKSCGCMRSRGNLATWKGCGDISGYFFACLKASAKHRHIEFALSIQYIWDLFVTQGGTCVLTGLPLYFATVAEQKRGMEQTASLDRKNSLVGYVEGNVQWVHKDVNYMKCDFAQERFVELCRLVTARAG